MDKVYLRVILHILICSRRNDLRIPGVSHTGTERVPLDPLLPCWPTPGVSDRGKNRGPRRRRVITERESPQRCPVYLPVDGPFTPTGGRSVTVGGLGIVRRKIFTYRGTPTGSRLSDSRDERGGEGEYDRTGPVGETEGFNEPDGRREPTVGVFRL